MPRFNVPIPANPIGENFAWRDWLQKLSNLALGTAAFIDVPVPVAQGGTAAITAAAARTNLGVLAIANNLSDVANAGTARTNLGLGTMATQNTGATGTFLSANVPQKTITVVNGIITSIV